MRQQWQMWNNGQGLKEETLKTIYNLADVIKIDKAQTNHGVSATTNSELRSSKVAWMTHFKWIRDELYEYVKQGNRNAFGVDVDNIADIQYTEYHASEGGHYDWHIDTFWDEQKPYDRKISVTVQLSGPEDYKGGDFEFDEVPNPDGSSKEKGTVLMFPSYLKHRVKPVSSGIRKSLVAWFEGPRWR